MKITKWQTSSQYISHFWLYAFFFIPLTFVFYCLLRWKATQSVAHTEMNGAADGVEKVTQGLYVACSDLCIQLLEKPDLTERNNPGEVNYTGRASRSSHRRLKCDVINAGCRCRRRCLPFLTLSRFSLSVSLSPAQVRSYTRGKSRKNSMGWERTPLSTRYREGVRKTKNQGYQHHGYSTQNPLNH